MKVRKSLAAGLLAASTLLVAAGCSSDDGTPTVDTNKASAALESAAGKASAAAGSAAAAASSAAGSAAEAAKSAASNATNAAVGLTNENAQVVIRKAVDPATSETELTTVVDATDPATMTAIKGYAKSSNAAGYTPDAYVVKAVQADGMNKANVTVAVKSPHAPEPVDMTLSYVKIDGNWLLTADSVNQLASMGGQHGG
ncbi:DUF4878 domain-containing protein [Gordonia sp. CPCC 205515]|uniref:DUF4878 domain-containing protein n=1 Tax=Gordonia sp. CPCC 205515 TaxID=3140791 RepID=UPI003AF3AF48